MFTWIPIHREAIHQILKRSENQQELLTILSEMEQKGLKVISLGDKGPDNLTIPLAEIDPFTFLASFNRGITGKNRRDNWNFLKARWNLESAVPADFTGIPILHPMRSRLMPWAKDRKKDHVALLWQVAAQGADGDASRVDPDLFDRCVKLDLVGMTSLTIGLFWINPEKFLATDRKNRAYGRGKGVGTEPTDYRSYRQWLTEMTEKVGANYPELSHQAHIEATRKPPLPLPGGVEPGGLGKPFDFIFDSLEEAQTAFDIVRWTLDTLGVAPEEYESEERVALTLPQNRSPAVVRLNFGNWPVLAFFGPAKDRRRVEILCQKSLVEGTGAPVSGELAQSVDDEAFTCISVDFPAVSDVASPVRRAFHDSLLKSRARFDAWRGTPYRIHHRTELLRMVYDKTERDRLLRDGLDGAPSPPPPADTPVTFDKKEAMKGLFLSEAQFDEMLAALSEKRNVVLQGAPGVGKTYVARRLAYALMGSKDPQRIEVIQFHQSYSYEDFIQGFRPTPQGHFGLKYGIFHQFCCRAQRDEGRPHVFIIDEINRGNLSKIFGELMMLIEPDKRGREHAIPLAYSQDADERFHIPENVYLIGMMNTADRSLAMVDYALRRRFRFITLRPEFSSPAFEAFLGDAGASPDLVKRIVTRMNALNEVIAADTRNLGPGYQIGHSYFCPRMGTRLDGNWYRRVIESEIVPLIQEYWFDNEQKVNEHRSALLV